MSAHTKAENEDVSGSIQSLRKIFEPRSVAIIGASSNPSKRGYQSIKSLLTSGFKGKIFPVHPKEESVLGLKAFPTVLDIPEPVDLAVICTPANTTPALVQQCGQKGIVGAVLLGAGFSEMGDAGVKLEEAMLNAARKFNVRIIGPNTSGMFNLHHDMDLVGFDNLRAGGIGLISQSGNMALTIVTEGSVNTNIGFSNYVGVGNQSDLQFADYLEYFAEDENTKVIVLYVEGLVDGQAFLRAARRISSQKPIILYKSGRTSEGQHAAASHTGALAGSFALAADVFEQAGINVVRESDRILPLAETFSLCPLSAGNRVAVLADGGGHATIAVDALIESGVQISKLSEQTIEQLNAILPATASLINPVDVAGGSDDNPSILAQCADIILSDDNVDSLVLVGLFGGYSVRFSKTLKQEEMRTAAEFVKVQRKHGKPLIVQSLYEALNTEPLQIIRQGQLPVFGSIETACFCLAHLIKHSLRQQNNLDTNDIYSNLSQLENQANGKTKGSTIKPAERDCLYEYEAYDLLKNFGINAPKYEVLRDRTNSAQVVEKFRGQKLVAKIVSKDILHKSDAGAVKLNIEGKEALEAAYDEIIKNSLQFAEHADIEGVMVAPMGKPGLEIIIGVVNDPTFGHVMMFGLGGIFVEVLGDVSFRSLPMTRSDAKSMINDISARDLLLGTRGSDPVDQQALVDLIINIQSIVLSNTDIKEVDFNPIIISGGDFQIVDARVIF